MPRSARPLLSIPLLLAASAASAATPAELLEGWQGQAGAAPDPQRGRALFTAERGDRWHCTACHGDPPNAPARHAGTGKPIAALAPAANPERFTDADRAEKWFRRNCRDALDRECTALEKADVLAWLLTLPAP